MTGMINDMTLNCLCIYVWENVEGMQINYMNMHFEACLFFQLCYDKPDGSLFLENTVSVVSFLCQIQGPLACFLRGQAPTHL